MSPLLVLAGCSIFVDFPGKGTPPDPTDPADTGAPDSADTGDSTPDDTGPPETDPPDTEEPTEPLELDTAWVDTGGEPVSERCVPGVAAFHVATGDAFGTVVEAVASAPDGETVQVCPGRWDGYVQVGTQTVTLAGYGPRRTFLESSGEDRVLRVGSASVAVVRDLALIDAEGGAVGGCASSYGGALTMERTLFYACRSTQGGGLTIYGGDVVIRDSVFARNGTEATGGAIFVADVADPTTLTLSGTTFEDNEAVGDGGAIWIGATATVRVTDSLFVGNAADGGGAFAYDGELRSDVAIEGTTFRQNRALDRGGAFLLDGIGAASIAITDSVFEGNQALRVGGAILVESELSPSLVVTSSVFEANDAGAGGVFAMGGDDAPTARFVESTVFGNTAFDGAAFYLGGSDGGALSVEGGAVTENVASGRAGGFYLAGSATLTSVGVDWGEGATENLPEDAEDFAAGAGASFTCTSDGCE